jgi:hypothetical protein
MAQLQLQQLEVLVFGDILMDSLTTHLSMLRLAPIQIAFWGHPFTSGFPTIDYFISSDSFEIHSNRHRHRQHTEAGVDVWLASEQEERYSEQLVLFTSLSSSFLSALPEEPEELELKRDGSGEEREGGKERGRERHLRELLEIGQDIHHRPYHLTWTSLQSLSSFSSDYDSVRIYSCLQSLMKMHSLFDETIAQVIRLFFSSLFLSL